MHVLQTDASGATINPLYIQTTKAKTTPPAPAKLSYWWWIGRAFFSLIVPIVSLWVTDYHVLTPCIWACYVLVAQTAAMRSVLHEDYQLDKWLGVALALWMVGHRIPRTRVVQYDRVAKIIFA